MVVCQDCGLNFPHLLTPSCKKCQILETATSKAEHDEINERPQCKGCSVVYRFFKTEKCGGCDEKDRLAQEKKCERDDEEGVGSVGQTLLTRSLEKHKTASKHRLNQPAGRQNPALQAASATKEKLNALRKQNKVDTVTIDMSLYIFPANGGAAKKAQLVPLLKKFNGSDPAVDVFQHAKTELKKAILAAPVSHQFNNSRLNFEEPTFGVAIATKVHQIDLNENRIVDSVEAMFDSLKNSANLSDSDIKSRNIPLRVFVYEVQPDSSEDDDELVPKVASRHSRIPAKTPLASIKRKASRSFASSTQYTSSYRPAKTLVVIPTAAAKIQYDQYQFTSTTFSTDQHGNVNEHIGLEEKTIKIARDWQSNISDVPNHGYLAKGLTKFAFLGRFNGKPYAIFQCKPVRVTESQNLIDLTAELRLMAQGQYFAESFAERVAKANLDFDIPSIRWNFSGTFLGTVTSSSFHEGSTECYKLTFFLRTSDVLVPHCYHSTLFIADSFDIIILDRS